MTFISKNSTIYLENFSKLLNFFTHNYLLLSFPSYYNYYKIYHKKYHIYKRGCFGNKVPFVSIDESSLFICFVCHVEISQTTMPLAMLLVPLESTQRVGVHWVGFVMFQPTLEKLLNIEPFFKKILKKSYKSKLNITWEFGHGLGIPVKPTMSRI